MNEKILSRSQYEVIHEFTASRLQSDPEYAEEARTVQEGVIIWADPDYWKNEHLGQHRRCSVRLASRAVLC